MESTSQLGSRRPSKYYFGGLLCCLLLVYAVGAKLALYHLQQPGAKSVAATKAWQNNAIPSVDVAAVAVDTSSSVPALLAVLVSMVFATLWCVAPDEPASVMPHWFSPYLSVRPPPTR